MWNVAKFCKQVLISVFIFSCFIATFAENSNHVTRNNFRLDQPSISTAANTHQGIKLRRLRRRTPFWPFWYWMVPLNNDYRTEEAPAQELSTAQIEKWADDIRNGDYADIMRYCRSLEGSNSLQKYLPNVITRSYGANPKNFDSVARFLSQVQCNLRSAISGWSELLGEVAQTNGNLHNEESLKLASSLWKFEQINKQRIMRTSLRRSYTEMQSDIPENIRALIWESRCTLQNHKSSEYLHSARNGSIKVSLERSVGSGNGREVGGNEGWWYLEKSTSLEKSSEYNPLTFAVKSMNFMRSKPFLCANMTKAREDGGSGMQTCYRSRAGKHMLTNWVLEPVTLDDVSEVYRIYSWDTTEKRKLYLNAVSKQDGRASDLKVLEERGKSGTDESYWNIKCK